jgi:hypothetical protein
MPNWKKIIVSGSDAALNSLYVSNQLIVSGSTGIRGNISGSLYIDSDLIPTTTFNAIPAVLFTGAPTYNDNVDIDVFYSGNSGSYHTELSSVGIHTVTGGAYETVTFSVDDSITLSSGNVTTYTLWVNVKTNPSTWWVLSNQSLEELQNGIVINLSGNTNTNLGTPGGDLENYGFVSGSNPIPYPNTFRYQIPNPISFIGDTRITGSLFVTNDVIISRSLNLTGDLNQLGTYIHTGSVIHSGSKFLTGIFSQTGSMTITGSTTQIGNTALLGNTLISGSIIISGSTTTPVTPTIKIYGDMETNGVIKFMPVVKNIDTSISGSYIYVSGSTNDLYFSQNGSGFNNVTRLRWLEGNLYTGLLRGGLITTASSTVYQVSSGSGIIVNLNASLNNDPYPTIQFLQWGNLSASIAPFTASYQQAFVGIDSTNNIFAQGTPFSNGQFDNIINIGGVFFQNQSTINGVKTQPSTAYGFEQQQNIFNRAFGPLKLSGYTLAPSGSSTLGLIVASGTAYAPGSNYTIDPNKPSYTTDSGTNISKIFRYHQSGSTWVYNTNAGAGFTSIDPGQYSNNGTLTTVQPNDWSIQRVFWFPNSVIKAIVVYYGNQSYSTEADAIANISIESFVEAPNTSANAIYLGAIVIRGNGVLTTPADFTIVPGGLFRQVGGSGGGGSVITQTLSGLSDVSISGPTNGQALVYDTTAAKWENKSFISASISGNAGTALTALTASYLNTLNQNLTLNGDLTLNGTASINYLNVVYESASVIYSSGSNQFGDASDDTQILYGLVKIPSGSLSVSGTVNIVSPLYPNISFEYTRSGSVIHGTGISTPSSGSFVQGYTSVAYGNYSFVHGANNLTSTGAEYSHAEGSSTITYGQSSHAEGASTVASGSFSHAEGGITLAIGEGSHTEGHRTLTYGAYSHAEGYYTTASADYSLAAGRGTTAAAEAQIALGKYNIVSTDINDTIIIGGGTDENNLHTVAIFTTSSLNITGSLGITGSLQLNKLSLTKTSIDIITGGSTTDTSCNEPLSQFRDFRSIHIKYNIQDAVGGNYKAGNIVAITDGSGSVNFTDTTTAAIGNTSNVILDVLPTNSNNNITLRMDNQSGNDYTIITEYTLL